MQTFDPTAALREPDVAQPTPEQPALAARVGRDAERPKPPVDRRGVHPDAVVAAAQLVPPVQQRRSAESPHGPLPLPRELRIGRPETQHDPPGRPAPERDR